MRAMVYALAADGTRIVNDGSRRVRVWAALYAVAGPAAGASHLRFPFLRGPFVAPEFVVLQAIELAN
jgi:hypothetical protein